MHNQATRRAFLKSASSISLGFLGLQRYCYGQSTDGAGLATGMTAGYGPLIKDPSGILDLPSGFSYQVISRAGEVMHDGFLVPGLHDGMATFAGPNGRTILIRNHECEKDTDPGAFGQDGSLLQRLPADRLYDRSKNGRPPLGGTTTLLYDTQARRLEKHFLSLAGTLRNCAGGPTPWGSWLSCEENTSRADDQFSVDHGYVFEVPAQERIALADPIPLVGLGRFRHEAVAVEPASGIVYETEDMDDGLLYRFLPNQKGDLRQGGRLQALVLRDRPSWDTRNWPELDGTSPVMLAGQSFSTEWIDLDNVVAPDDDLRYRGFEAGAARFARGEGMWYGRESIYFACTSGGKAKLGQIWRYHPSPQEGQPGEKQQPGHLELFLESHDKRLIENADNLTVAPWGDVFVCEDGPGRQRVVGVTPQGQCFRLAKNALNESEFAGVTFSPEGTTMFVNIYNPGLTLAIWGPWQSRRGFT